MAGDDKARNLRDVLRIVFRRWRMFIVGAAMFATAALILWHFVPVKYTGNTIFERRMDAAAAESGWDKDKSFGTLKQTQAHELKGYEAVAQAVEDLGLTRDMPRGVRGVLTRAGQMAKQELVRRLMKQVKLTWEARSEQLDLVLVSFTDRDPVLAEQLPNTLVKNYINRVSQKLVQRLTGSRDFLLKQVTGCRGRLTELNRQKIRFETKHAGMMPESPGALQKTIQDLLDDIETRRHQLNLATQQLARLRSLAQGGAAVSTQPSQVIEGPNPELKRLQQQLQEAKDGLEAALMLRHMTEKHPTVKTLRSKIVALEERIAETPPIAVLHRVYGQPVVGDNLAIQLAARQSEVEITTSELERLQRRLATHQRLMANFEPIRQEYVQIQKKIDDQQTELSDWEKRLAQVQMNLAAEVAKRRTHHEAVQAAQKQFRPSFPSLWMVVGFAVVGGFGFGGGLVFLANSLDRSIVTIEDASESFALPIHGVIGEISTARQRVTRAVKRWTVGPVVTLILLAALGLAGLSAVLWLRYPDEYKQWKVSPTGFLYRRVVEPCGELVQQLKDVL